MKVITETKTKIRKPRHCWGCKVEYPQGTLMNRVVSVDGGNIQSAYWCKTCDDYLAEHHHEIDFDNGFGYGDLLNFDDYIPFNQFTKNILPNYDLKKWRDDGSGDRLPIADDVLSD